MSEGTPPPWADLDAAGRINPGGSPSLLLNGHVDVIPAEAAPWSSDPFVPVRSDGWLIGRRRRPRAAGRT